MRAPSSRVLAVALAIHAVIGIRSLIDSPRPASDFDRYYVIASAPGRPYVDYQVEHPIGTLVLFKMLARPGCRSHFGIGIVALNLLGDALIVASLLRGWARRLRP